jgi:hypothetical protein
MASVEFSRADFLPSAASPAASRAVSFAFSAEGAQALMKADKPSTKLAILLVPVKPLLR